ncbi:MAG: hypothetical protein J5592_00140, partial [Clostridia bacterium]|nr:hypothetical protein [Clostridia bacterium]
HPYEKGLFKKPQAFNSPATVTAGKPGQLPIFFGFCLKKHHIIEHFRAKTAWSRAAKNVAGLFKNSPHEFLNNPFF